ncbi:hypothetical protein HYPSUDRAFT_36932 [Hypholoma sublateritium FD-334 SS-4]|uniref:Cytochrome P450 n=1 Tax=Hypholoma sublateritium (strain FD-334 SS-4) TaxID=945553 RepID=A0A0D2Q3C1_HYPSF|nr:hypothetical protein HYPSUDRAFT_36932 [Hypholoma sublateritium FD-334 SS-4]
MSVYTIFAIGIALYLLKGWLARRSTLSLPPGPKGYPFIGNVYDIPHHYPWLTYTEWARIYGDVFSFSVFGKTTVVLNSIEAVTELLEKRSSNYSDRPRMVMANELMNWDWDFAHMRYSDWWRRHRRMFHQYFQPRNIALYHPIQKKLSIVLLDQLVRSPAEFAPHIRQFVASIVLQAAYGHEVKSEDDFYINLVHAAVKPLLLVVHATGKFFVEFVPSLKYIPDWIPGAGFKRNAKIWRKGALDVRNVPFDAVKKSIDEGSAQRSFVYDNMEKIRLNKTADVLEEEEIVKNCAAIIYLAGSDTTASLLLAWVMAMVLNPDVQKRAQEEIDQVVGMSRLPEFSDRNSMPYIQATLFETLRWFSVTPLALPHRAVKEDEYNGFRIPAGATVTPNTWAILHDERLYPEPFKFDPNRFLKDGVVSFAQQPDPLLTGSFGYGRRNCPGRYLALDTAWIAIASILATSHIGKTVDGKGQITEPVVAFTDGLVSHMKPYQVHFAPRFHGAIDMIESAKAHAL